MAARLASAAAGSRYLRTSAAAPPVVGLAEHHGHRVLAPGRNFQRRQQGGDGPGVLGGCADRRAAVLDHPRVGYVTLGAEETPPPRFHRVGGL